MNKLEHRYNLSKAENGFVIYHSWETLNDSTNQRDYPDEKFIFSTWAEAAKYIMDNPF